MFVNNPLPSNEKLQLSVYDRISLPPTPSQQAQLQSPVGRAMVVGQRHTSPQIRHAQKDQRQVLAPSSGVQTSTRVEVPFSRRMEQLARASPRPLPTNIGKDDPSMGAREGVASSIKDKFRDIFNVSNKCVPVDNQTINSILMTLLLRTTNIQFISVIR